MLGALRGWGDENNDQKVSALEAVHFVDKSMKVLLSDRTQTPQLAGQIRAIKDPSSTLPVPIPVDMATSKKVTVQGVEGIFVGDSTGLGSAVIWQKDGIVYGVAGTLTEQQVLAVANSLH